VDLPALAESSGSSASWIGRLLAYAGYWGFIWRSPPYADWTFGSGMLLRSSRLYRISKETALGSLEVRSK